MAAFLFGVISLLRSTSHSLSHLSINILIRSYGAGIFDPRSWGNHDDDVANVITLESLALFSP